jgi:hypothetical protein
MILSMGKKASRKIGNKKTSIFNRKTSVTDEEKNVQLENKLLELSDEEIENLYNNGKIDQNEYEYILNFRKKKKEKKKSDKEKFEERIRCSDTIIQKVVELGRKFRIQEMFRKQESEENRRKNALLDQLHSIGIEGEEQDIEREERLRSRNDGSRSKNERGRNSKTRDSRGKRILREQIILSEIEEV